MRVSVSSPVFTVFNLPTTQATFLKHHIDGAALAALDALALIATLRKTLPAQPFVQMSGARSPVPPTMSMLPPRRPPRA